MLMVIFGAGASYDSVADRFWPPQERQRIVDELRPPLAAQLFDARTIFLKAMGDHHHVQGVVPYLRARLLAGENVEDAIERVVSLAPQRQWEGSVFGLRFYLSTIIKDTSMAWLGTVGSATNYQSLMWQIAGRRPQDEPVVLVTFNYDTLLELALRAVTDNRYDDPEDYVRDPFPLFKLHGSETWVRVYQDRFLPLPTGQRPNLWQVSTQVWTDESYYFALAARSPSGVITLPAIAVPVRRKSSFECSADHLERLAALLPKVDRILVIGWRGLEENFTAMLTEGLSGTVDGYIVAGGEEGARETAQNLHGVRVRWRALDLVGFSALVGDEAVLDEVLGS
jgi:hypothetical protein